jgi:hypothetical protein
MKNNRLYWLIAVLLLIAVILSGCDTNAQANNETPVNTIAPYFTPTASPHATDTPELQPTSTLPPNQIITPTPSLPLETGLNPVEWMEWPILPIVTKNVQEIYALGQKLGRDPRAFSIFGDCQGLPEEFLGQYEISAEAYNKLPENLQETVDYFEGSLNRDSATVKPGTTTGALLWEDWHEGLYGCRLGESPVDCEIRTNNPSFVIIAVGTHYETRNQYYMELIIENLLENGIVPILSTKADNREGNHSINLQTAQLAIDYNIPMWNFWQATSHLPDNGLVTRKGEESLGQIYYNDEVKEIHRISALETLDTVWRALDTSN